MTGDAWVVVDVEEPNEAVAGPFASEGVAKVAALGLCHLYDPDECRSFSAVKASEVQG